MQAQMSEVIENLFHEFDDHAIYGLEYIMDEFSEVKERAPKTQDNKVDWFGLSDLSI